MARRPQALRYTVDGSEKSYADIGPALSLSVTLATRSAAAGEERTHYVRDSIGGKTLGYSESTLIEGVARVSTKRLG